MPTVKDRERRINWIKEAFFQAHEKDDTLSYSKLIAEVCLTFNCCLRTAKEYMTMLKLNGFYKQDRDLVWFNKKLKGGK